MQELTFIEKSSQDCLHKKEFSNGCELFCLKQGIKTYWKLVINGIEYNLITVSFIRNNCIRIYENLNELPIYSLKGLDHSFAIVEFVKSLFKEEKEILIEKKNKKGYNSIILLTLFYSVILIFIIFFK